MAKKGKLKRSFGEKCPDCLARMEIREREVEAIFEGLQIFDHEEYKICPNCGYFERIEKRKRRNQEDFIL